MSIRITGMFSGLDTESIISELVSAQSVKKNSLVKAQTKLSWKQDAWKALNTKIYDFYTNTLSDMRYQASYLKKTTKVSNTNAISVITSDNAVDGVRGVKVDQLAKGARLTSGSLVSNGVAFSGAANLSQLLKHRGEEVFGKDEFKTMTGSSVTGSFRVVGAQGQYLDFDVNENTTIDDIVGMIQSTGLNANFDQDSQRIFISSKNTGAINNFSLVANDEGGMNALACLGLLSKDDLRNDENQKWSDYKNGDSYTDAFYEALSAEITSRLEALLAENKDLQAKNDALDKQNSDITDANNKLGKDSADLLDSLTAADFSALTALGNLGTGELEQALEKLYGTKQADGSYAGGLYDAIAGKKITYTEAQDALKKAQEAYDAVKDSDTATEDDKKAAKDALDDAQDVHDALKAYGDIENFINDVVYGELKNKEIDGLENSAYAGTYYQMQDENGKALNVYEKLGPDNKGTGEYYASDGTRLTKDTDGNFLDKNGKIIADSAKCEYVQERSGGLKAEYAEAEKNGTVSDELKAKVDVINKLNNVFLTVAENKAETVANEKKIAANNAAIDKNNAAIDKNNEYMSDAGDEDEVEGMAVKTSKLAQEAQADFEAKVAAAKKH